MSCLMAVPKLFTCDNIHFLFKHINAWGNVHHSKFETKTNFGHFLATIWQTYRIFFAINACFYDYGKFSFFLHIVKIIFFCDHAKFSFMVTAIFSMQHGIFWCADHGNFFTPTTIYIWTNFKFSCSHGNLFPVARQLFFIFCTSWNFC